MYMKKCTIYYAFSWWIFFLGYLQLPQCCFHPSSGVWCTRVSIGKGFQEIYRNSYIYFQMLVLWNCTIVHEICIYMCWVIINYGVRWISYVYLYNSLYNGAIVSHCLNFVILWHVMLLQILFKNISNYFSNDYIYQNALKLLCHYRLRLRY